jgi:hypothetical protein
MPIGKFGTEYKLLSINICCTQFNLGETMKMQCAKSFKLI